MPPNFSAAFLLATATSSFVSAIEFVPRFRDVRI
jgi:hypothetical protein